MLGIAWETPLNLVVSVLDAAKRSGRNVSRLWEAIERGPNSLVARVWEAPLNEVASILDAAKRHKRNVSPLWEAIEREPRRLAARAWETTLGEHATILDAANRQQRNVSPLWNAIEAEPDRFATCAFETPLNVLGAFFELGRRHQRDLACLWTVIMREPAKLAARAYETPLDGLASFLNLVAEHGQDSALLWEAIEKDSEKLVRRLQEDSLDQTASFLETAHRQGRNTQRLWDAIEARPDELTARVSEGPLEHLAYFLDTARRQGRNVVPLWDAIESDPERLASRAWKTPIEHIASFQRIALQHQRDVLPLWDRLQCDPERLARMVQRTSAKKLASFFRDAPLTLTKTVLANFQPTDWDSLPDSQPFVGATWLAFRCGGVGRDDLKSAIIKVLLRRANPLDFPFDRRGLADVAWMLMNVPADARALIAPFLSSVCRRNWLQMQFTGADYGVLAKGLRLLALHQSQQICRHFQDSSLGIRMKKALLRLAKADPHEQSLIVQFVGCASLLGFLPKSDWLASVDMGAIGKLPVDGLPHRPDAAKVEEWQFQLWLGLRALTSAMNRPLPVPSSVILQTLNLWKMNVVESTPSAPSTEHDVNKSMVAWLDTCSHLHSPRLLPARLLR